MYKKISQNIILSDTNRPEFCVSTSGLVSLMHLEWMTNYSWNSISITDPKSEVNESYK